MPEQELSVEQKICKKCGLPKSVARFARFPRNKDGLHSYCKDCQAEHQREKYQSDLEGSRARARSKKAAQPRTESVRIAVRKRSASYRARWPEKKAAHAAVKYALKTGELERKPCERCGAKAEAHHDDYNKPLEVMWLCRIHHAERHRELATLQRERQIAEKRQDIDWICGIRSDSVTRPIKARILAVLEAQLAMLKYGMKSPKSESLPAHMRSNDPFANAKE